MRILLVAVTALLTVNVAAHADTLTQTLTQTVTNLTGPQEDFGGIALFNPALGTLNTVTQTVYGNFIFMANSSASSYSLGVNGPGAPITTLLTYTSSGLVNVSVTSGPTLEESSGQFGQQYVIEPFDVSVTNGSLSSVGPVTDTFTFNYTPAAVTPEPSSLALLGTGLLSVVGMVRKRFA